jgi:hypothetical protein
MRFCRAAKIAPEASETCRGAQLPHRCSLVLSNFDGLEEYGLGLADVGRIPGEQLRAYATHGGCHSQCAVTAFVMPADFAPPIATSPTCMTLGATATCSSCVQSCSLPRRQRT